MIDYADLNARLQEYAERTFADYLDGNETDLEVETEDDE